MEVSVTSVLNCGALPIGGSGNTHRKNKRVPFNFCVASYSVYISISGNSFCICHTRSHMHRTLTGGERHGLPFTQRVVLLCVQRGGVLRVGLQVEDRVLREASGQAQLLGVGALNGEEETVAGDLGPGGEPQHDDTVLGHVGEMDVCGSVGL